MVKKLLEQYAKFHHIGIAVKDFNSSIRFYESMGYSCSEPATDELHGVHFVICSSEVFPNIELVSPINEQSPVNNYLKKQPFAMYHMAFIVEDLSRLIERIKQSHKVVCITGPNKGIAYEDQLVSFYYVADVGIFEFIETVQI